MNVLQQYFFLNYSRAIENVMVEFISQEGFTMDYDIGEDHGTMEDDGVTVQSPAIIVANSNRHHDRIGNSEIDKGETNRGVDDTAVFFEPLELEFDSTMTGMMGALVEIQKKGDNMLRAIARQQTRLADLKEEVDIVEVNRCEAF